MGSMGFKGQLFLAFGTAAVLLAGVAVVSYQRILQEDADQKWVEHTHLVLEELDSVLVDLINQETGQRGYALTGTPSFLEPYDLGRTQLWEDLKGLRRLTSDNPKQQSALDRLEPLVKDRTALFQQTPTDGFSLRAHADIGKQLMDQIRALLQGMKEEEQDLLRHRLESASIASWRMKVIIGSGGALALFLILVAGSVVQSEIRKRSRTEQELRSAEERYHLLFDSNPIPAWVYDTRNVSILDVNAEAIAHYGYSRQEFLNSKITDLRPPEDIPAVVESAAKSPNQAQSSGPWRHKKKSGELIDVEIKSYPLVFAGKPARLVVALDVTQRKLAEEEMRLRNAQLDAANKELEAFSYSVSHDLRAPLRSIDGFSQALLEDCADKLDDAEKTHLARIRAGTQRMGVLIDDLLNLSRVARAEMRREKIDVSALAHAIAGELKKTQSERRAEFRIEDGIQAMGDPHLMRIVLENLLGNAWKFTSKHASARIEVGRTNHNGTSAYFVRDNGAGFDPAYVGKLFGAFQRLHGMTEFPGTGVGLATVQRIIHRHGGKIWAEGALEKGASFYFTL
jgi:PAS domain S-box-containing protein